jgi:DNA-directed RNA polymerase specialized sigma24 family protein
MTLTDAERLRSASASDDVALEMDEETFRAFYDRTARALWVYLSRVTGSGQRADDLLQETYYRFLRAGSSYANDAHRRNSLFRIAAASRAIAPGVARFVPLSDGDREVTVVPRGRPESRRPAERASAERICRAMRRLGSRPRDARSRRGLVARKIAQALARPGSIGCALPPGGVWQRCDPTAREDDHERPDLSREPTCSMP